MIIDPDPNGVTHPHDEETPEGHEHEEHGHEHHDHDHEGHGHEHELHAEAVGPVHEHEDEHDGHHGHEHAEHEHAEDAHGDAHDGHDHGHDHHGHGHDHGHHGHSHAIAEDADFGKLGIGLALLIAFMLVEVVIGIYANSVALLSDAAHMLTDAGAIGLSMFAIKLSLRPAEGDMTYGLKRAKILSALVNGEAMFILAIFIIVEAVRKLVEPEPVRGGLMLIVALIGTVINIIAVKVIAKANREDLNIRGSYQHMLTDLYAFIGTALAAGIILLTGFYRADAIMSLVVAALMVRASIPLIRDSVRIMLQIAPKDMKQKVQQAIEETDGVVEVSDFNLWELSSNDYVATAMIVVENGVDDNLLCHNLRVMLADQFNVRDATIQPRFAHEPSIEQMG